MSQFPQKLSSPGRCLGQTPVHPWSIGNLSGEKENLYKKKLAVLVLLKYQSQKNHFHAFEENSFNTYKMSLHVSGFNELLQNLHETPQWDS